MDGHVNGELQKVPVGLLRIALAENGKCGARGTAVHDEGT